MQIIADPKDYAEKEQLYYDVRNAEGRIMYSNEVLLELPYVENKNRYKKEWDIRANSLKRLIKYLKETREDNSIKVLDVGCGNGWMTHRLHKEGYKTTGIDLNMAELMQAEKVFGSSDSLQWIYGDIMKNELHEKYDIILFAASCQYFENITELTRVTKSLLSEKGEIHFLDSIFYKAKDLVQAKQRSNNYYKDLGFPGMGAYYFHHSEETLKGLGYNRMNPGFSLITKSPLQWWILKKQQW